MKKKSVVISAFTPEANLKRKLRTHLKKLGFERSQCGALKPPSSSKEAVRALHQEQRKAILKDQRRFLSEALPALSKHFANGDEIDPTKVLPRLETVEASTWQSDLFRLASLTWSVPVSAGYGRRLRYLVWDDHNNKLLGIIALGHPVFNLKVRDELIDWTVKDRGKRLVNILDAYVLGAVPPYNMLLGGKLVACLVRSKEVRHDFLKKYGQARGIISKKRKGARLVMVTTSSSLGRSSVYNRLRLKGKSYFKSIGYTQGWGHFHIPDALFADLRHYLRRKRHKYVNGHKFGEGPNWRLRTIRAALDALGFKADLLRHGIGREVFACSLASNAKNILRGKAKLGAELLRYAVFGEAPTEAAVQNQIQALAGLRRLLELDGFACQEGARINRVNVPLLVSRGGRQVGVGVQSGLLDENLQGHSMAGIAAGTNPSGRILNDYVLKRNLPDEHQLIRDMF